MSDLSLTILAETANDAQVIERLHERTFGPGRFVLSAYRIREHVDHLLDLSFTAWIGTLLVGSVRQLPVVVGDTKALLLGPLTVEPSFRSRGVGRLLLERALRDAKAKGHRLVLLVGDEAYYRRAGFKTVPEGRATMPVSSLPNSSMVRSTMCPARSVRIGTSRNRSSIGQDGGTGNLRPCHRNSNLL